MHSVMQKQVRDFFKFQLPFLKPDYISHGTDFFHFCFPQLIAFTAFLFHNFRVSRGGRRGHGSRSNSGKKDSESVPSVKDLDMDIDNYMKEGSEKAR